MRGTFDLTDIPTVTAAELWFILEQTLDCDVLTLCSYPLSQLQLDAVNDAFWLSHNGTGAHGLAVSHRLAALLQSLSRRRFAGLAQKRPHEVLKAAVHAAATLRLNPKWGFNAMRFSAALHAAAAHPHRFERPAILPPLEQSHIAPLGISAPGTARSPGGCSHHYQAVAA